MKSLINKIKTVGLASLGLAMLWSCSEVLDETPRSIYDPGFFQTDKGIEGGLTSLYSHLRNVYGNGYYMNIQETGTDEYTYGQSADGNFKDADLSGAGSLTSSSSRSDVLWNNVFTYINTASGIIENAVAAGIDESKISEARFFRAFDYFNLVRTFGGVPLDFGSGELAFNATPSRTSVRNTVPEVYTKAIFPDLIIAVANLPETPRTTGAVTKTVARKYLAEAYLTYAWWLENPKNIPTYPECSRVDPDGHDAAWYSARHSTTSPLTPTSVTRRCCFGLTILATVSSITVRQRAVVLTDGLTETLLTTSQDGCQHGTILTCR